MKDRNVTDQKVAPEDYSKIACALFLPSLAFIALIICAPDLLGWMIIFAPVLGYGGVVLGKDSHIYNSASKIYLLIVFAGLFLAAWAIAESGEKKSRELPTQHVVYYEEQIMVSKLKR